MSKYSGRGLLASFENEEDTVDAAPMVEDADNAEAALADAGEVQADINEAEGVVDQAIEDSETLETVASQLESREQSGGATPEEAEMAEITVESICNRLGIARNPMQSMESFSSRSSRVRATRLSVEGIREVGDTIWKYIVKIYKKIKEWVLKAWDYLFDARTKLLRRAKALEARVDKVEGTPKEAVIQGSFVEPLSTKAGFEGIKNAANLADCVKAINDTAKVRIGDEVGAAVTALETKANDGAEKVKAVIDKIFTSLGVDVKGKISKPKDDKNYKSVFDKDLGNEVPVIVASGDFSAAPTDKESGKVYLKAKVEVVKQVTKFNKDFKAKVLTESEMSTAISAVVSALEDLEETNKDIKKYQSELEKAIKKFESVGQSPSNDTASKEANKAAKEMMKALTAIPRLTSGILTSGTRVVLNYCRSAMDYVQKSAAQYKNNDEDDGD